MPKLEFVSEEARQLPSVFFKGRVLVKHILLPLILLQSPRKLSHEGERSKMSGNGGNIMDKNVFLQKGTFLLF